MTGHREAPAASPSGAHAAPHLGHRGRDAKCGDAGGLQKGAPIDTFLAEARYFRD